MPGRTKEEIRDAASSISVAKEWEVYGTRRKNHVQKSYSYSFETRAFYDASKQADRHELIRLYSDGANPVNMVAMHDVFNKRLTYSDIVSDADNLIDHGLVPFIGYWKLPTGFYTGVSMSIDHGVSDPDITKILKQCDQMCAARVFLDRVVFFPRPVVPDPFWFSASFVLCADDKDGHKILLGVCSHVTGTVLVFHGVSCTGILSCAYSIYDTCGEIQFRRPTAGARTSVDWPFPSRLAVLAVYGRVNQVIPYGASGMRAVRRLPPSASPPPRAQGRALPPLQCHSQDPSRRQAFRDRTHCVPLSAS